MDNSTIKKLADKFNKTEQEIVDSVTNFEKMKFNAIDTESLSVNLLLFQKSSNERNDENDLTKHMIDYNI